MRPEDVMRVRVNEFTWIDSAGSAHIEIPHLLEWAGMEDTPQNREEATKMAQEVLRELGAKRVINRQEPTDYQN